MNIRQFNFFKKSSHQVDLPDLKMPDIPGILPILPVNELISVHAGKIASLNELAGLSESNFNKYYQSSIHNFARLVQLLPASEVHHHATPGGMLSHTLDVCVIALKLRQSYVLSTNNNAEDVSVEFDSWTYSIFLAALCHDLAKPVVDQIIDIYDQDHKKSQWVPWSSFLDEQGTWYTCRFVRKRQYHLHEKASLLLIYKIIPAYGMEWLSSNQTIFMQWLACVSGDNENALSIGDIVSLADSKSVASNLGAESSNATASITKAKSLHEKMLTALRVLLLDGDLPLNRNGAAGWVKGNSCWLVSKRTIDAIRDQLTTEGHTGLPSKNGRMYDILQEHGILTPCGDKAIWRVSISDDGWENELTVINIPVSKIWINPDNKPDEFEGMITPSEKVAKEANESELLKTEEKDSEQQSHVKTSQAKSINPKQGESNKTKDNSEQHATNTEKSNSLDISSFLPTSLDEKITKNDLKETQEIASDEKLGVFSIDKNRIKHTREPGLKKKQKDEIGYSNKNCDTQFFQWLQEGVLSGKIKTNAAKARVHVVNDGVIVITPGIFQDFSKHTDNKYDWMDVQKLILKKKLHRRDDKGLNVIKYEVKGQSKMTTLNAILFNDITLIFGNMTPPTQNPHLNRIY